MRARPHIVSRTLAAWVGVCLASQSALAEGPTQVRGALGGAVTDEGRLLYDTEFGAQGRGWRIDLAASRTGQWWNWPRGSTSLTCDAGLPGFGMREGHRGRGEAHFALDLGQVHIEAGLAGRILLEEAHRCEPFAVERTSGIDYGFDQRSFWRGGASGALRWRAPSSALSWNLALLGEQENTLHVGQHWAMRDDSALEAETEVDLAPRWMFSAATDVLFEQGALGGNLHVRPSFAVDMLRTRVDTLSWARDIRGAGGALAVDEELTVDLNSRTRWDLLQRLEIDLGRAKLLGFSLRLWEQLEGQILSAQPSSLGAQAALPPALSLGLGVRFTPREET